MLLFCRVTITFSPLWCSFILFYFNFKIYFELILYKMSDIVEWPNEKCLQSTELNENIENQQIFGTQNTKNIKIDVSDKII